jgi:hypothetical protein
LHIELEVWFWYLPAAQLVQFEAPSNAEYVPMGQSEHEVADVVSEYFPAAQLRQLQSAVEYIPRLQGAHGTNPRLTGFNEAGEYTLAVFPVPNVPYESDPQHFTYPLSMMAHVLV